METFFLPSILLGFKLKQKASWILKIKEKDFELSLSIPKDLTQFSLQRLRFFLRAIVNFRIIPRNDLFLENLFMAPTSSVKKR